MTASLKAVLFDAGNTLLFLDHDRMAAAVGAALGVPLDPARLAGAAGDAARVAAATERSSAAAVMGTPSAAPTAEAMRS